jgi:hypothetical protein
MFAQPPQTAKLKSILNQELGHSSPNRKANSASRWLVRLSIRLSSEVRTSWVAHDQRSRARALKESVEETRETESLKS